MSAPAAQRASDADTPLRFEKPVAPWISAGILEQGYYHLGGAVARLADVAAVRTPAERVALWGLGYAGSPFDAGAASIDVLRFPLHPLMALRTPDPDGARRPWPTYANGFLPGVVVAPVWQLERTRVPAGAELWRVDESGEERLLAVYAGPAIGWRGSRGYYPPAHLVGTRAKWHGLDVPAEIVGADGVELVVVGAAAPDGFDEVRAGVWRRVVPREDVTDIFELILTCRYQGVPCRIIQRTDEHTRLLLLDDDPEIAARLHAEEADVGSFEVTVPTRELEEIAGSTRSLASSQ